MRAHPRNPVHQRPGFSLWAAAALIALVVVLAALTWGLASALRSDQGENRANVRTSDMSGAAHAVEAGLAAAAEHLRTGRFAEASAILAKLTEDAPFDSRVRLAHAQALIGLGEHARAYDQYLAAITVEQEGAAASTGGIVQSITNNPALAQLHGEAGTCALKAGFVDRAIEHYAAAQLADSTNPRFPLFLAMAQIRAGEDGAAMASLVRVTLLQPDAAEAWGTMAELELRKNRVDLAAQHLDRALALQPDQLKWRLVQGRIFNRKGEPERTVALLSALGPEALKNRAALRLMGESYGLLGRPADAAALYERAAQAEPTDADLWYQAALWHERAGDADKRRRTASTAAMLGHPEAHTLAGADVPVLPGDH
ncbi:MAG: hypothetical protein KF768_00190 [Phycisphaeraceae bacterium]|nr:hypothetical protein [Phycisphaeraceae bacterium]